MHFNDVILLLKVVGGSVNIGIAIKYLFIWSMRKNPVEESNEYDPSGRIVKTHKKFR